MYSSNNQHNLTYFPDVYNCIIGSHLIDRSSFVDLMMKHSGIMEYIQIQERTGPIIDQLMILFMNFCSSRIPELNSDQILTNSLSTGPLSKKALMALLPEWFVEGADFREKVLEMAKLTVVNSFGVDAKLEITKHQMDNFDPFYWAFPMDLRLKAWSHFKEKRRSHMEHFYDSFVKNYPLADEIKEKIVDFLIEILLNFVDSASTDCEFALEAVLIIFKAICSRLSDSKYLDRISDCIQKFKLKKNISESVSLFLGSIYPNNGADGSEIVTSEASQVSKEKRKSSILASFKRQRDVFIGEPQATYEDDENICVVCSESGSSEDNFLGFPLQISETSLMSIENEKCPLMRGCYHLVHKKCFDSLPVASNGCKFKVCSLCNSAIDKIIPLQTNPRQIPSELEIVNCPDLTDITESFESSENNNNADDPSNTLLRIFCNTLVYICETDESVEALPLHQILTLTQMKRHLIENLNLKLQVNDLVNDSAITFMKMLVSHFILYARGQVSIEEFSFVYKRVVKTVSIAQVNFALNLLMHESISKSSVVKAESDNVVISANNLTGLLFKKDFIELPDRHDLFLKEFLAEKCKNCGTIPKSAAVCLLCGTLVCVGQLCCRADAKNGECSAHRQVCSGDVGIFFIVKSCSLLIVSENIGVVVPAPYVNAFGEHDFDLSSASALFLNKQLYYGKLRHMWKNYELRDFIMRNMGDSRVPAWSML